MLCLSPVEQGSIVTEKQGSIVKKRKLVSGPDLVRFEQKKMCVLCLAYDSNYNLLLIEV